MLKLIYSRAKDYFDDPWKYNVQTHSEHRSGRSQSCTAVEVAVTILVQNRNISVRTSLEAFGIALENQLQGSATR